MDASIIIIYILVFFAILGAIDKILGNRFGLGKKFEEGILALGPLAIAMLGIIFLAPVIATLLKPILVPVYGLVGADPSMFAATLLANDMGGYSLATSLALNAQAGLLAGLILGSMMGATIVFTIPVALGIIKKQDHRYLALGVLFGMITIPLGFLVGGIAAGFDMMLILVNLVPITIISLIIILGLWKIPELMIKIFIWFGKLIIVLSTLGIVAMIVQVLTGFVVIPGMTPFLEGLRIIGTIALLLAGAFPALYLITRYLKRPLAALGKKIRISATATAGLIATLANNIPMFGLFKDMDSRGKVMNVAFAVSASFILGDHLAFTAAVHKEMILPVIAGKLVAGITALILAGILFSKFDKKKY